MQTTIKKKTNYVTAIGLIAMMMQYAVLSHAAIDFMAGTMETFDSNITSSHTNEKADFISALFLAISGSFEGKNGVASITGRLTENIFTKYSEYTNFSQSGNGSFELDLSKYCRLKFSNTFSHAEEPTSFDDAFGADDGRYDVYRNNGSLMLEYDLSEHVQLYGGYLSDWYEASRDDIQDSLLHAGRIGGTYFQSSQLRYGAFYEYGVRYYDPGDAVNRHSAVGTARYYFDPQWYLDGEAGADFFETEREDSLIKPRGKLALTYDATENTAFTLTGSRHYIAQGNRDDLFNQWRTSLQMRHRFTDRVSGSVEGFYGRGTYHISQTRDDLYGVTGQVSYDITAHIKAVLSSGLTAVDSNVATNEYVKTTTSLGISVTF